MNRLLDWRAASHRHIPVLCWQMQRRLSRALEVARTTRSISNYVQRLPKTTRLSVNWPSVICCDDTRGAGSSLQVHRLKSIRSTAMEKQPAGLLFANVNKTKAASNKEQRSKSSLNFFFHQQNKLPPSPGFRTCQCHNHVYHQFFSDTSNITRCHWSLPTTLIASSLLRQTTEMSTLVSRN